MIGYAKKIISLPDIQAIDEDLGALTQDKSATGNTACIFSLHSNFSQKYSLHILQNHGNKSLNAPSLIFLAQIRKYVLIFANSYCTSLFFQTVWPHPVWL